MSSLFEDEMIEDDVDDINDDASLNQNDPFPSPRENNFYASNQKTEDYFLDLISKNVVPHAFIFSGIKGVGKATFAYRLARYLLKYGKTQESGPSLFGDDAPIELPSSMDMEPDDAVFRRVASGGHPDLISLSLLEGKKSLDVAQIRKVEPFLRKKASEDGGWRIVIVDDADTMNNSSQNALLKILEEPPSQALIILISHNSGSFLPTIHSRCRTISIKPPEFETFADLLRKQDSHISLSDLKTLYEYSSGSIGKSLQFLDFGGLELLQEIIDILQTFPQADFEKVHLFSERFSRNTKDEAWANFCDLFIWIFETLAISKAKGAELPDSLSALKLLNSLSPLEEQIEMCQMLQEKISRTNVSNLDKRQCCLEIFMILNETLKR